MQPLEGATGATWCDGRGDKSIDWNLFYDLHFTNDEVGYTVPFRSFIATIRVDLVMLGRQITSEVAFQM